MNHLQLAGDYRGDRNHILGSSSIGDEWMFLNFFLLRVIDKKLPKPSPF